MNLARLSLSALLLVAAAAPGAHAAEGKYQLQNRSSFTSRETDRPPFWPIGWVKRQANVPVAAAPVAVVPKYVLEEKNFTLTSILLGNPSLAVINGRAYSEGEFVRLPKGNPGIRIRVQRIGDGAVILNGAEQQATVKLRRGELGPKKVEEDLLNEER